MPTIPMIPPDFPSSKHCALEKPRAAPAPGIPAQECKTSIISLPCSTRSVRRLRMALLSEVALASKGCDELTLGKSIVMQA